MVNMDSLISQVRHLNHERMTLEEIHDFLVTDEGVTEGDFFLAYKAAEMLPGWVTQVSLQDQQALYDSLFV